MAGWKRRIVVVEDETLVATLVADLLTRHSFEVQVAHSAAEARQVIAAFDPDAALVDIHLGAGPSGLHLGHVLRQAHPEMGIVFLSRFTDPAVAGLREVDIPDGCGFIAKEQVTDADVLLEAVNSALRGEVVIEGRADSPLGQLTPTQNEILRLAATGMTNAAIAKHRKTSERTVEMRLKSVYAALGILVTPDVNPRVEAVRQFIEAAGVPEHVEATA
jgi:two-component system, NarL family, nitrate/nitrite response regulator NarL